MEFLIRMAIIILIVVTAMYIAIKYDKYEKYISCYFIHKIPHLVRDPMDAEWEYLRKHRGFYYIEKMLEEEEETIEIDSGYDSGEGSCLERCA